MSLLKKAVILFFLASASSLDGVVFAQGMTEHIRAAANKSGGGIANWYSARGHQPVWDGERLGALAQFIRSLDAHGLSPALFKLQEWDAQWRAPSPDPAVRATVEVGTTQLALYAIQSLAYGFTDPSQMHGKWKEIPRKVNSYQFLDQALQRPPGQFAGYLLQHAPPQDKRYAEMVKTLERYRQLDSLGGWRNLPATATAVGVGHNYPELQLLRSRLAAEGDLPGGDTRVRGKAIDQRTADAIKSFQFRHGIDPDGYIGAGTLRQLNTPVRDRLNTLIINIDRLRWMPRTWEQSEHIEVNIAERALRLFNNRREVTVMPVVVGIKGQYETPVFHGNMTHLIFRPNWNAPHSIARRMLVPNALKDPQGYMTSHGYQIVKGYGDSQALPNTVDNLNKVSAGSLLIRQLPGPKNSMGLVKFMFPNDSAIYLHDTNDHSLFERAQRDFSSGCVRVARPDELASLLLQRSGGAQWTTAAVRAAMQDTSRNERRENLGQSMPVYLIYWTSTIMSDGRVRFDDDIYGHDAKMLQRFGLR